MTTDVHALKTARRAITKAICVIECAELAKAEAVAAERERITELVRDHLKRAAGITDKEFADGYSFAVQEILAAIQGAA